ncbi:hypothetical protein GCM10027299_06150 [Larkinella ripae]
MRSTLRYHLVLVTFFFLAATRPGRSQSAESLTIGKEHTLHSAVLGEERSFFISVPASYDQDEFYQRKRYPVLILLDADTHFRYASSMIHFLSEGSNEQIPELIVVAVRNTNRTRDMTSDLPNKTTPFAAFLEKELLPHIDQHYRTLPYRLLVGHSLAGLFAVNCLLNQNAFNAYIAIDPTLTWNNRYLPAKADSVLKANTALRGKLYVTQANNPFDPGPHTGVRGKSFDSFRASLTSHSPARLSHRYAYYEQETHFSVPFRSLHDGLLFVFENYEFPVPTFLAQGSSGIRQHYQRLFEQWGANLLPPGKVMNQVSLFLLQSQKQADQALDLLKLTEQYYPDSPVVHRSLGEAYQAKGDKAKAIQAYRKVLALKATDEKARQAIQTMSRQ